MSDSSTLFVNENEDLPDCRLQPFLPDTSASENESDEEYVEEPTASEVLDGGSDDDTPYCVCRKSARGFMIGCDGGCNDWFHGDCVGVTANQKDLVKQFVCPSCTENGHGVTVWVRTADGLAGNDPKQGHDMAENNKVEDDTVISRSNHLLRQSLTYRKQALQPPLPAAVTRKKIIGRSRLRAQPIRKNQDPASLVFGTAARMSIAEKLKYSLPTFEARPPGLRAQLKHGCDDDGGSNSGDEVNTNSRGRAAQLNGRHIQKLTAKAQRRSYVDVEEAPTTVDVLVKKSLEQALFGAHDE